jgi:ketosteroid isomerase-like protein
MSRLAAVFFILLLAGMAQAAGREKVLLQADREFNKATQERRLEGWMSYMADNVVLLGTNKPAVGKDAVRETMKELSEPDRTLSWQPTRGEMFKSGTMGYTTGRWVRTFKNEKGEKIAQEGSYLTVWGKAADGSWKVLFDTGAPDESSPPR